MGEGALRMPTPSAKPFDPRLGLRGFLLLDAAIRLLLLAASFAVATALITLLRLWPAHGIVGADLRLAWEWSTTFILWILFFNLAYVALLILLRLPIPTPKEGRYRLVPGRLPDRQLIWSCLLAVLTKARYEAPFPAFLVFHAANLPPLCWLMGPIFGPKSKSCYITDPLLADPHLIEVGRNVVIGYRALVSAHTQGRDEIIIKKTIIEDDVIIGGDALIYSGCHLRRGAVILGGAILQPDTVVGENEVWGGVPARHIKTLPPIGVTVHEAAMSTRAEDAAAPAAPVDRALV